MKRKSVICSILALTLILAGTGYAYWTDTLNVTTKATTGKLDVTFIDLGPYAQYDQDLSGGSDSSGQWSVIDGIGESGFADAFFFKRSSYNESYATMPDSYKERARGWNKVEFSSTLVNSSDIGIDIDVYGSDTLGSDEIVIDVKNIYPGYAQAYRTDIANIGTIAAKLSDIKFSVGTADDATPLNAQTSEMLGLAVYIEREYGATPGSQGYSDYGDVVDVFGLCKSTASTFAADDFFTLGNVKFLRLSALDGLDATTLSNADLLCLPNLNRMDLFIGIAMDPDAVGAYTTGTAADIKDNDDTLTQNKGAQIKMDLVWSQFNEGKDADTTNRLTGQN